MQIGKNHRYFRSITSHTVPSFIRGFYDRIDWIYLHHLIKTPTTTSHEYNIVSMAYGAALMATAALITARETIASSSCTALWARHLFVNHSLLLFTFAHGLAAARQRRNVHSRRQYSVRSRHWNCTPNINAVDFQATDGRSACSSSFTAVAYSYLLIYWLFVIGSGRLCTFYFNTIIFNFIWHFFFVAFFIRSFVFILCLSKYHDFNGHKFKCVCPYLQKQTEKLSRFYWNNWMSIWR